MTQPDKEESLAGRQFALPFNDREQLVKVAVYRSGEQGDSLVGEATVPIADPSSAAPTPWPLIRDFEAQGSVTLQLALPETPSSQTLSNTELAASASSVRGCIRATSGSAALASHCRVGEAVEVYSKAAGKWLSCHVSEVEGNRATLVHGSRHRRIDLRDEKLEEYLRLPAPREGASDARPGVLAMARGGGA